MNLLPDWINETATSTTHYFLCSMWLNLTFYHRKSLFFPPIRSVAFMDFCSLLGCRILTRTWRRARFVAAKRCWKWVEFTLKWSFFERSHHFGLSMLGFAGVYCMLLSQNTICEWKSGVTRLTSLNWMSWWDLLLTENWWVLHAGT